MASIDSLIRGVLRTASNTPTSFQMILSSKGTEMQQTSQNQRTLLSKNLHGLIRSIYIPPWVITDAQNTLSMSLYNEEYRNFKAYLSAWKCPSWFIPLFHLFLCQWSTVTCLSLILHWLLEWERTQLECKVTSWVNHKCHKTAHLKLHTCCDH